MSSKRLSKLEKIVLSYPKLDKRVSSRESELEKVLKIVNEVKAQQSSIIIKMLVKFLDLTLAKLYDGMNFSLCSNWDFPALLKKNNVVLVPNHQSHADYIALNYMIYKKFKQLVHIAGGINLNIFGVGRIFRLSGCFFIRRTFGSDILYKLTLEAYLYYLLHEGKSIEFFFEGGRSRSGKLQGPRFGLYQMIMEAHQALPAEKKKKLIFIPISIIHEYVPETRTLARELEGAKKHKESFGQFLKVFKIFTYRLGSVHIKVGKPVEPKPIENSKKQIQDLAFDCFREVGNNMLVTPTSLLALIMLNEPSGALKWEEIYPRALKILAYCKKFDVPYCDSLAIDQLERTLEDAIDLFINNKKIDVIGESNLGHVFYAVNINARNELLYFKNTILHHFLIPWIINLAWSNIFNGTITNVAGIRKLLMTQRKQLKYEFYIPTVKQFAYKSREIISYCVGREIDDFSETINLSFKEFYSIVSTIGVFSKSLIYIHEGYYISALAVQTLNSEMAEFSMDDFNRKSLEIYNWQKGIRRVITFSESFSRPLLRNSIKFFLHHGFLTLEGGLYRVLDTEVFDDLLKGYEKNLMDQLSFNIRES